MRKLALIFVLSVFPTFTSFAQSYSSEEYFSVLPGPTDIHGWSPLARINDTRSYSAICYNNPDHANFIVRDNNGGMGQFNTIAWDPGTTPENPSGYKILDMDFDGNTCYFCGIYWTETGNVIYTFDGQMIVETVDKGFVGRFDAPTIINGTGKFETMFIDETRELSRIKAHNGGISCIGKTSTGGYSCLAEIHESPSNPSIYSYRVSRPSNSYEVLMDLAKTSNKVVTVSRFTSPETNMKYYFGLRYGNPTDFFSTNTGIHIYDNRIWQYTSAVFFNPNTRVHLCDTRKSNEVVVSFVLPSTSPWGAQFILYKVIGEGVTDLDIQWSYNESYDDILDIGYCAPINNNAKMAVLLKKGSQYSLRFPTWGHSTPYTDTVLRSSDLALLSIAPYQSMSNSLELMTAGNDPSNSHLLYKLMNYNIHGTTGYWSQYSCIPSILGSMEPTHQEDCYIAFFEDELLPVCLKQKRFTTHSRNVNTTYNHFPCVH